MARAGSSVDLTVDAPGRAMVDVCRSIETTLHAHPGYIGTMVGPGRYQLVRTYRPTWAVAGTVLGALLCGLGLLCLLVRHTDTCLVVVSEGATGARVTISGRILAPALDRIASVTQGEGRPGPPPEVPHHTPAPPPAGSTWGSPSLSDIPPPPAGATPVLGLGAPSPEPIGLLSPAVAPARPAPVLAPPVSAPVARLGVIDETVVRGVSSAPAPRAPGPGPYVTLSDGRRLDLDRQILLGRDPALPAGWAADRARVVRVVDEQLQVSKTHLSLRLEQGEVWVEDLHSTNGTTLSDPVTGTTPVHPGQPVRVPDGGAVLFGTCRAEVHLGG